jgi:hypothetical protein
MIRRERLNSAEKFKLVRKQNGRKMTERTKQQYPIHGILHLRGKWKERRKKLTEACSMLYT